MDSLKLTNETLKVEDINSFVDKNGPMTRDNMANFQERCRTMAQEGKEEEKKRYMVVTDASNKALEELVWKMVMDGAKRGHKNPDMDEQRR